MTDQEVIHLIDCLTGDDFCVEMEIKNADGKLDGDLKIAVEKLLKIYTISHSHDQSLSCYKVHDAWRADAEAIKKEIERERKPLSSKELKTELERLPCPVCGGDPDGIEDKDCMCGGSRKLSVYISELKGCIEYWRAKAK